MPATSVQFTVAAHIMALLGFYPRKEIPSAIIAERVNADPTFVRKSLSRLSNASLITTARGKNGGSILTRPAELITLLDIYRPSAAPPIFAIHNHPVDKKCPISRHIKGCMSSVLKKRSGVLRILSIKSLSPMWSGRSVRQIGHFFKSNMCYLSSHIYLSDHGIDVARASSHKGQSRPDSLAHASRCYVDCLLAPVQSDFRVMFPHSWADGVECDPSG